MTKSQNFLKGIWKENPILVSALGMCPTLAITTSLENALGMGAAVLFVLVLSNLIISLIRKIVPSQIRIPVYIVVIASLVTIVDMIMAAYLPGIHASLGIFIPLIVVNCIILGRAEAFASENKPIDSVLDAVGMAIGYTLVIAVISIIREVLGTGTITVWKEIALTINPDGKFDFFSSFFVSPAGSFIVIGLLFGIFGIINKKREEKKKLALKAEKVSE